MEDNIVDKNKERKKFFVNSLLNTLSSNYFKIGDDFYTQTIGLPMGNKLSPILANNVMKKFDTFMLNTKGISFYQRHVDDTLIIFNEKDITCEEVINKANKWKKGINFTFEKEMSGAINFLKEKQ